MHSPISLASAAIGIKFRSNANVCLTMPNQLRAAGRHAGRRQVLMLASFLRQLSNNLAGGLQHRKSVVGRCWLLVQDLVCS